MENKRALKRYYELKEKGLCTQCTSPLDNDNHVLCESCRETNKKVYKIKIEEYKVKGLCTKCGEPNTSKYLKCDKCRKKHNDYQNKWLKNKKKNKVEKYKEIREKLLQKSN